MSKVVAYFNKLLFCQGNHGNKITQWRTEFFRCLAMHCSQNKQTLWPYNRAWWKEGESPKQLQLIKRKTWMSDTNLMEIHTTHTQNWKCQPQNSSNRNIRRSTVRGINHLVTICLQKTIWWFFWVFVSGTKCWKIDCNIQNYSKNFIYFSIALTQTAFL